VDEIDVESPVELTSFPEEAASEGLPTPHDGLTHRLVVHEGEAGSTPHPHPPPMRSKASWEGLVRTFVTPDETEEPGDGWHEAYAALSEQVGTPSLPSRSSVALNLTAV
jgi:hypothetical protein